MKYLEAELLRDKSSKTMTKSKKNYLEAERDRLIKMINKIPENKHFVEETAQIDSSVNQIILENAKLSDLLYEEEIRNKEMKIQYEQQHIKEHSQLVSDNDSLRNENERLNKNLNAKITEIERWKKQFDDLNSGNETFQQQI